EGAVDQGHGVSRYAAPLEEGAVLHAEGAVVGQGGPDVEERATAAAQGEVTGRLDRKGSVVGGRRAGVLPGRAGDVDGAGGGIRNVEPQVAGTAAALDR